MKAKKILSYSFAGASLLSTLLQIIAFPVSYDRGTNYFESHAILPIISLVLLLIAGGIGIVSAFVSKKDSNNPRGESLAPFATALPSIGFLLTGIYFLITSQTSFETICGIVLLIASLYFVCDAISKKDSSPIFYLGFFAVIGCILLTGRHYFDMTVEMNAPIKVSLQAALLFSSVFFTQELRCRLGKATPHIYRAIAAWTIAIGCHASIPAIIAYLAGFIDRFDYFCTAILVLSITVLAALRLIVPQVKSTK